MKQLYVFLFGFFTLSLLCCFIWITEHSVEHQLPKPSEVAELYANQNEDDLRAIIIQSIRSANKSILLIIYSLTDPDVINVLRSRSEEGRIEVSVICHAQASPYISKRLGKKVKLIKRFGPGLMHQKILVIDKHQVWIGSANMTHDSLSTHANLITAMDSEELATAIYSKSEGMEEYGKGEPILHQEFIIGGQQVELWFLPDDRQSSLRIKKLLRTAEKTIRVGMFTFTRLDFAKELAEAKNRGVDVQVALDLTQSKGASLKVASYLKEKGIHLRFNDGKSLLHHKFLYIDSDTLVNGSANWTNAAFNINDDCFVILNHLNEKQKEQMDRLWEGITKETSLR